MSKKNNAPAKNAPAKNAPAKKANLGVIIPVAALIIGLVIMTVCFFNVKGKLDDANVALANAQQQLAGAQNEVQDEPEAPATTDDAVVEEPVEQPADVKQPDLQAELTAANDTLAAKEAELTAANDALAAKEAELAATNATIAEKDALLVLANDAINQATAALSAIASVAEEEAPAEDEVVVEEEPAAEAEAVVEEEPAAEAEAAVEEEPAAEAEVAE